MASSGRLKPKGKGRISVSVDTMGKSGRLTKTVRILSNDPTHAMTILSVTMSVIKPQRKHSGLPHSR